MARAENLATKSVNQYRSRDVFAYLGLRYYLDNQLTRKDAWAESNAIQIVLGSPQGAYLRSYHFKQINEAGGVEYRELFIPSASEALAEAALLAECAKHVEKLEFSHVFSYRLTGRKDRKSYFEPYMVGLRQRQQKISEYCFEHPHGVVAYIDIEQFYPSISIDIAKKAWRNFGNKFSIPELYFDLGNKLIDNHAERSAQKSILTGPMFSHFLANIVLSDIDNFSTQLPARYLRYVDDMTLIGTKNDVGKSIELITYKLNSLGLSIHSIESPKTLIVSTNEWLESAADFSHSEHAVAWMKLIGDIKKILLFDRSKAVEIEETLEVEGFRLPIPDYALAVEEASTFEKVRRLGLWSWLKIRTKRVTVETITADARRLSARLYSETIRMLKEHRATTKFQRKRVVSKLRYRLGRLIYLGSESNLREISAEAKDWPELKFHVSIMDALISSDCFEIVNMGSNVAQAAAQVIRLTLKTARFSSPLTTNVQMQGLAILILNGVPVEGEVRAADHPLLRFARGPIDKDLMSQPRGLVQELACLHGIGNVRHPAILESAFDIDENIVLDALELDYGYYM